MTTASSILRYYKFHSLTRKSAREDIAFLYDLYLAGDNRVEIVGRRPDTSPCTNTTQTNYFNLSPVEALRIFTVLAETKYLREEET